MFKEESPTVELIQKVILSTTHPISKDSSSGWTFSVQIQPIKYRAPTYVIYYWLLRKPRAQFCCAKLQMLNELNIRMLWNIDTVFRPKYLGYSQNYRCRWVFLTAITRICIEPSFQMMEQWIQWADNYLINNSQETKHMAAWDRPE